jgi:leucyl-tRNA synthetase
VWRLFHNQGAWAVTDEAPVRAECKVLHKTIKKIEEDMERFSFNTSVSTFMICVNELTDLGCRKRAILEPLALILAPYAPHLAEELWLQLGHEGGIATASFPAWNEEYLTEDSFVYPVSVNGKTRFKAELSLSLSAAEVEAAVLAHPDMPRFLEGKQVKKVVVVPGKIANVVAV